MNMQDGCGYEVIEHKITLSVVFTNQEYIPLSRTDPSSHKVLPRVPGVPNIPLGCTAIPPIIDLARPVAGDAFKC